MDLHLELLVEYKDGKPMRESVHAEALDNGCYRLLFSPGFVQGIGAGDEFRVLNQDGKFEVVRRAGNVVVQVFSKEPIEPHKNDLKKKVETIGGSLDGAIDRGMVFSIPVTVGFKEIERLFTQFVESVPGTEWAYGNVYDPMDGKTPLNWWYGQ